MIRGGFWFALSLCFLLVACGDEDVPQERVGVVISVPFDTTFAGAVAIAEAGDTIRILASVDLASTVHISREQTPLVILGGKVASITGPQGPGAALVFDEPLGGTSISSVAFAAYGDAATGTGIMVSGGESIHLEDCSFWGFAVQVLAEDVEVTVERSLMAYPGLFSIDAMGNARVWGTSNTLVGAGDCGIRLSGLATLTARNNLIAEYRNFGIACNGSSLLATGTGCNNVFDSLGVSLPYFGCAAPETDFSLDPLFCNLGEDNFTLQSGSPCLDRDDCGLVGVFGEGCP